MKKLTAENITRIYHNSREDVVVLDGFDAEIEDGEIVAVVGPSGCGKSTFLRLVSGLDHPQSGRLI